MYVCRILSFSGMSQTFEMCGSGAIVDLIVFDENTRTPPLVVLLFPRWLKWADHTHHGRVNSSCSTLIKNFVD